MSQNCCADWHSHLSWGKIRSREVIRADGQSSGGSVCSCNTPAVLTLKLCVVFTAQLVCICIFQAIGI